MGLDLVNLIEVNAGLYLLPDEIDIFHDSVDFLCCLIIRSTT